MFSPDAILERAILFIPVLLSLTVHEWAHAISAYLLGDDTAERLGRMTLNPIAHIDPIGTILLPLLGIPFGWAKPVPVDPTRFRRSISMGSGMAITAAAGPFSNVVLAVLCTLAYGLIWRFSPETLSGPGVREFLLLGIQVNVALALFNMLPIPPLDGSRVVDAFVPYRLRRAWESIHQFAPFILLAVIVSGGTFLAGPRRVANQLLMQLLAVVAGPA